MNNIKLKIKKIQELYDDARKSADMYCRLYTENNKHHERALALEYRRAATAYANCLNILENKI